MEQNFFNHYADEQILFRHSLVVNPPKDVYKPHSHNICELLLFKRGDVKYITRGRQYQLKEDDLVFSRPLEIHDIQPATGVPYERYNILFDEKTLPFDIWSKFPENLDIISFRNVHSVLSLFEKMDYYRQRLDGAELKLVLTALTQEIFVNIMIEMESAKTENDYVQTNDIVCRAISYIEENLTTLSGIEEVAAALFITKSHLHHLFIRHMGITPKKYILTKRLALAHREISAGGKPTDVYRFCGFADYSVFYRAYRSHFGKSPSDKSGNTTIISDGFTYPVMKGRVDT